VHAHELSANVRVDGWMSPRFLASWPVARRTSAKVRGYIDKRFYSHAVPVDMTLPIYVDDTVQLIVAMSVDFSAIFITSPCSYVFVNASGITNAVSAPLAFIPLGLLVFIAGFICGRMYMKAQLAIKREMSNAKAPILAQ
jgi:hypothetical protein